MKKHIKHLTFIFLTATLSSCKMFETVQESKFVSVENLYNVKLGSTIEEVIASLGSKPYNILSNQIDGYSIFTYKYKLVEREVSPRILNKRGGETVGTEVYNSKQQTVFLFFKNGKLESFITTDGRKESPSLIMLNNTVYTISKDKDKFVIIPTSTESSDKSSQPAFENPLKKKKK